MKGLGENLPPIGSGSLPAPRLGFAATVIPWDIVLCNVKYKWNTDSCDSYLHVIMTLRPAAFHSCPYGLILSFSLSRPASSMVGFWQLLFNGNVHGPRCIAGQTFKMSITAYSLDVKLPKLSHYQQQKTLILKKVNKIVETYAGE